jgi:transducin (beta)-like 1
MPASPAADEDFENLRKRQIVNEQPQSPHGHPAKRPRLSNGYENGFETTLMEVDDDQNGDGNAYPSPEQLPSPVVATVGPEQGTQVDKVNELSTETAFIDLSDDPTRNSNAILLQCEFNPRDPTILAAAGTDALARMWTLSRATPDSGSAVSDSLSKPTFAAHHNLLDDNAPPSTTTTGLSWASDGSSIAVSSEPVDDGSAKVDFWRTDGSQYASFNSFESPVICLRWNLSNTACLGLSPENDGKGALITVMNPIGETSLRYSFPNHSLLDVPLDAAWTSDEEFVVCGGDILQALQLLDGAIAPARKYETRDGHALSKITYDWRARLLATASDTGTIDVCF